MKTDVLIVGNSAREDALGYGVQKSPDCGKVYFAPGNAGTAQRGENVPLKADDVDGLLAFAQQKDIGLTIVGGEAPLPLGIVDKFRARGRVIFGPTAAAAQIECSKEFSKGLFVGNGVPTAKHQAFHSYEEACKHLLYQQFPIVIKASGLAEGKGSRICSNREEAIRALHDFMCTRIFKASGDTVVIEDFLKGRESSVHTLVDEHTHVMIDTAWQDHKYAGAATADHPEGTGLMTGGMGTYNPVPWMTKEVMQNVDTTIVFPTVEALRKLRIPFTGCVFHGLMMTPEAYALEANCRPGAPETESWMRNMEDTLEVLHACARNKLSTVKIRMGTRAVVSLVLASAGYPGEYQKGYEITGIDDAKGDSNVEVFHAGTVMRDKKPVTNGGRVLTVSATGNTLLEAQKAAYAAADKIQFLDPAGRDTKYVRPDIGHQGLSYAA